MARLASRCASGFIYGVCPYFAVLEENVSKRMVCAVHMTGFGRRRGAFITRGGG